MAKTKKIETFLIAGFGKEAASTKEETIVKNYFKNKGFALVTSREIDSGPGFSSNIVSSLKKAQAVIILLNKERLNVAFEIGIRYSQKEIPPFLNLYLADKVIDTDRKFSDSKDVHWIFYRKKDLSHILKRDKRVKKWMSNVKSFFKSNVRKKKKIFTIFQKLDCGINSLEKDYDKKWLEKFSSIGKDLMKCR